MRYSLERYHRVTKKISDAQRSRHAKAEDILTIRRHRVGVGFDSPLSGKTRGDDLLPAQN